MSDEEPEDLPERLQLVKLPDKDTEWNFCGDCFSKSTGLSKDEFGALDGGQLWVKRGAGEKDIVLDRSKHEAPPVAAQPAVSAATLARLKLGTASSLELQRALAVALERQGAVAT